jgi:hypothetical protein
MAAGEIAVLAAIVAAFLIFPIVLAWVSRAVPKETAAPARPRTFHAGARRVALPKAPRPT